MSAGASGLAKTRVTEERKKWRKDRPFGFIAKPKQGRDGTTDLFEWECKIPGKAGTPWAGGKYPVTIRFGPDYPGRPPLVSMPRAFFHPNVYHDGEVCLSILNEGEDWKASISVKQILLGVQELLDTPNEKSPAQLPAYELYMQDKDKYRERVLEEVKKYSE